MSNTTTAPMSLTDQLFALFKNSHMITEIYLWGFLVVFLFGFTGNIASLLTFSRPTLRSVSTGCLFIALAISDTFYLLVAIIDFVEFGLNIQIYKKVAYDELCRFRFFTSYVAQLNSAWILVFVSIDRWIRTRFPFKAVSICTPKNALIAVAINLVIDIGLNSHMLTPWFVAFVPGLVSQTCGPSFYTNAKYIYFYYTQWGTIQVVINCLVPALLMVATLIDIIMNIGSRRQVAFAQTERADQKTKNLQKNIFILLISRVAIFLATTLPIYIYRIIVAKTATFTAINASIINTIAILTFLLSFNYAANFYLNCLTSKLFRDEFLEQIKFIRAGRHARVLPATHTQKTDRQQNTRH